MVPHRALLGNVHNQVIEELRTRGRVDRPQLGMRLVTTDNREGKINGVMVRAGNRQSGRSKEGSTPQEGGPTPPLPPM